MDLNFRNSIKIAVIGGSSVDEHIASLAESVGEEIAKRGAILICGGLGGVMEFACKGAKKFGGLTIGILPGDKPSSANPYIDIPIATDVGLARNVIIILSCDVAIAIDGKYGTLSEIAYTFQFGKPIVGLETWQISDEMVHAKTPEEAVDIAIKLCSLNSKL